MGAFPTTSQNFCVTMINPSEIDFSSLPWLPLDAKSAFPQNPAIYFAIDSQGVVQYIGRSVNPRKRWANHHKYQELETIGSIKIVYLFIDSPELLPQIESALILWFNPALNSIGKPPIDLKPPGKHGESGDKFINIDKQLIGSIRWNKNLGTKLRLMRGKESMQSIAARVGCAYQLIQHLERGEYPNSSERNVVPTVPMDKLERICSALNTCVEDFLECPVE